MRDIFRFKFSGINVIFLKKLLPFFRRNVKIKNGFDLFIGFQHNTAQLYLILRIVLTWFQELVISD